MAGRRIVVMALVGMSLQGAQQQVPFPAGTMVPFLQPPTIVVYANTSSNANDNSQQNASTPAIVDAVKQAMQQVLNMHNKPIINPHGVLPSSPLGALAELPSPRGLLEKKAMIQAAAAGGSINSAHVGVGISCVAALCAWVKMKFLAKKALRNGHWGTWRSDIPCQVLRELSGEEIITQLWPAVRDRYILEDDVQDVFSILCAFLTDIEQERSCLQDLLWWYNVVRVCKLSNFLGDDMLENKAEMRCQRLDVLENCMHEWTNGCLCKNEIIKDYEKNSN